MTKAAAPKRATRGRRSGTAQPQIRSNARGADEVRSDVPCWHLFTDSFMGKTKHLDGDQRGFYLQILIVMWNRGLRPFSFRIDIDDEVRAVRLQGAELARQRRRVGNRDGAWSAIKAARNQAHRLHKTRKVDLKQISDAIDISPTRFINNIWPGIHEFFVVRDGNLRSPWLESEYAKAVRKIGKKNDEFSTENPSPQPLKNAADYVQQTPSETAPDSRAGAESELELESETDSTKEPDGSSVGERRAPRAGTPPRAAAAPIPFSVDDPPPEGWTGDAEREVRKLGARLDLAAEWTGFVSYWRGNGKTRADWHAMWLRWCLKEAKDAEKEGATNGSERPGTGRAGKRLSLAEAGASLAAESAARGVH